MSAHDYDRPLYPRAIKRLAERPEGMDHHTYTYSWEVVRGFEHTHTLIERGYEWASIEVGEVHRERRTNEQMDADRAADRVELEKLADRFLETGSFMEKVLLEKRERALQIVVERLREVTYSPFLRDALLAASPCPGGASPALDTHAQKSLTSPVNTTDSPSPGVAESGDGA